MDLEMVGRHVLFFDDDAMAAFVNSNDALVEWNSLQIDRYDVRHLLSGSLPPRQPQNSRYSSHLSDSSLESELDHERYLDLHESSDNQEMEDAGNPEDPGGYHAVSFSYGNASDSANQKIADGALGYHGYQPPFAVPESLAQSLPSTEKEHQIIARTALFVSQHGGQSEIVLRVKQGDNPTFGFLMPDHHMHLYFRFLVDHPEFLESNVKEKTQVSEKKVETASDSVIGGALTLLGSVYGDDEDGVEDSKSVAYEKTDNTTSHRDSHFAEKIISSSNDAEKEKVEAMPKLPVSSHKEKTSLLKKYPSLTASKAGHASSMKKADDPGSYLTSVKKSREPLIVEPPSDLKKLIYKIVEFIAKNGKQFEAALCEQDSEHLRFPFLLPSDQYHPYYLHVLQNAQESKGGTKNTLGNNDSGAGRGLSSGFVGSDVASYEFDRKEKFKMVIGKSKKDVQDLPSKATQQESAVTLDVAAAAAILKAATRGIKNPDLGTLPIPDNKIQKNNQAGGPNNSDPVGASFANASDSSEAHLTKEQKLKAERLRRARMFVAMLKSGNELPRCSSVEPVQSAVGSIQGENAREGSSVPIDGGVLDGSEIFNRKYSVDEHMERRKRKYRSRSDRNEDDNEGNNKDETELSHGGLSCEVDSDHKHRKEKSNKRRRKKHHRSHRRSHRDDSTGSSDTEAGHHKYSKKKKHSSHRSSSGEDDDDDDDERYNSSKYHKHKSHRHSHEYDYSSSDTKDISSDKRRSNKNHHSSHRSSREDGDDIEYHKHSKKKHRSHRSSHRKREKSDSSRDKEPEPSFGDAGKHGNSRYEEERKGSVTVKEELEEGEISSKVAEHHDTREGVICNENLKEKSNATQRSQSADVPDDLRAKIRAMLLATR